MVEESYDRTFKNFTDDDSYAKATFEIRVKSSKEYGSLIPSAAGRIRNNVARALSEYVSLPKFIIMITEFDVLKRIKTNNMNETEARKLCFRLVRWLVNEVRKMLAAHNDYLPKKAKRETKVVWLVPTLHQNYYNHENQLRIVFGQSLLSYTRRVENNLALELKQIWDESENGLYMLEQRRFTSDGLVAFWRALDRTIRYADTIINKNITTRKPGRDVEMKREKPEDRYEQNAPFFKKFMKKKPKFQNQGLFKKNKKTPQFRRKLPSPPPLEI